MYLHLVLKKEIRYVLLNCIEERQRFVIIGSKRGAAEEGRGAD